MSAGGRARAQSASKGATAPREERGAWVFDGHEAFAEVAKKEGLFNWALCGPDPETLPLSAGGGGGVYEMKEALEKLTNSFGLLRMTFGVGPKAKTKYVFIHASNVDDEEEYGSHRISPKERAAAMQKHSKMEKVIDGYTRVACRVELTSMKDCTAEYFCERLARTYFSDADDLTEESYHLALQVFLEEHPAAVQEEELQHVVEQLAEYMPAAEEEVIVPEPDLRPGLRTEEEPSRLRKKVKLFKKGDRVIVFSSKKTGWHDDGDIVETMEEGGSRDGFSLPAGSVKAQYACGRKYKWVTPAQVGEALQKSSRPPAPRPMTGEMLKENHNLFTEWHSRHFELSKGFLQWWTSPEDAKDGAPPKGTVSLLQIQKLQQGSKFKMQTASTKGVIYNFDAQTVENALEWLECMETHAAYCELMRDHLAELAEDAD